MAWPEGGMQQMIIARLSLNPSNISHYSKKICHKNDRTRERERERETQREKATGKDMKKNGTKEEGKRAGEQGTTGCISLIAFARSVNAHYSIWFV